MTQSDRQAYVRAMLGRFRDTLAQGSLGPSLEGFDSRLLLLPREHNQAMRELDRCIGLMRDVPALRFHTLAFYVDVHYRQVPRFRFVATRNGKRARIPAGFQLQACRHRDADEGKANQGVVWLSECYRWDRVHLKSILEAAGELAA